MKNQITQVQSYLNSNKRNPRKAIRILKPLLKNKNTSWPVFHYMGVALLQQERYKEAIRYLEQAIDSGSNEAETYHLLSVAAYNLGQFDTAENFAKKALTRRDNFFKAWLNLGSIYRAQSHLNEALRCYQKANQLDPSSAAVAFRIGSIYNDQGDLNKALELFDITLKIDPNYIEALSEKAIVLQKQKSFDEARKCLETILKKEKNHLSARVGLAEIYKSEGKYDEAIAFYEDILSSDADIAGVRVNYAICLQEVGRFNESEKYYLEALEIDSKLVEAFSNYLMGLHYNPERTKEEIFEAHLRWDEQFAAKKSHDRPVPQNKNPQKHLRIGFISGGFRRHPVGWMITKALEYLPKEECEIYCYTTNNVIDGTTTRINNSCDVWRSVVNYNDEVIAQLIREDEIDILVELSGHSADNRLKMVTLEPAPIIVKWVGGLFNTSGLSSIDYLISDHIETPEGEEQYYTEKLVRLPDDYICYMAPEYAPKVSALPCEKNGYITFGCFNNPTKINSELLDQWAIIMSQVPGSRLFLKSKQYGSQSFTDRIAKQMEKHGISRERLFFEGESTHDMLLEKYNEVDIALDPWPYSGGLSTCEALWMGVPVISLRGPTFAGRHAATHLHNAGLSEWITNSRAEYIETVVALADDPKKLAKVRSELRKKVSGSALCDGERFGRHLSAAFREMWKQWVKGHEQQNEHWQAHITIKAQEQKDVKEVTNHADNADNSSGNHTAQCKNKQQQLTKKEQIVAEAKEILSEADHSSEEEYSESADSEEVFHLKTRDGITICTPADLKILTSFVLLEQEQWFEPELEFVYSYLQPGMGVIDGGAAFGTYALPMSQKVGGEGKVYVFEPNSNLLEYLEKSKSENGFKQIEIISRALGEKTGASRLRKMATPEFNTIDKAGEEDVAITTLDAWWHFAGQPKIDLIKLDTNGTEQEALAGGKDLLNAESPVLVVSVYRNTAEIGSLQAKLDELDYRLFEYIPGPKLLAPYDSEAGVDPYLMNIIAIKEDRIEEFEQSGWIFNEDIEWAAPNTNAWQKFVGKLPWGQGLIDDWEAATLPGRYDDYLQVLNLIYAAEEIDVERGASARSKKGAMLLAAAQQLIELLNSEKADIGMAITLVRVMNALGKRTQALDIIRQLLETINEDRNLVAELPFLPLLPEQDYSQIQTDFSNWLKVRLVEAWVWMKDFSTFMSGQQEQQMIQALEDNPEASDRLKKQFDFIVLKENLDVTDKQRQRINRQLAEIRKNTSDKQTPLGSESKNWNNQQVKDFPISRKSKTVVIPETFWQAPISQKKAEIAVSFAKELHSGKLTDYRQQTVEECRQQILRDATDSLAFYIMVQALLSAGQTASAICIDLDSALNKKGWEHKKALYSYFYDTKEVLNEVTDAELSVIIVSNKVNEEVLKNLREIDHQRDSKTEVLFVSNGLDKKITKRVTPYVDILIHLRYNAGACMGRNFGAIFSKGTLLLFIDDDGIPEDGLLQGHKNIHAKRDICVARGAYLPKQEGGRIPWHYHLGEKARPAVCFLEGNTSFRPQSFFEVGGWSDSLLVYHEGMELSYRYYKKGFKRDKLIYFPDAVLRHDYVKPPAGQSRKNKLLTISHHLIHATHSDIDQVINSWPEAFVSTDMRSTNQAVSKYENLEKVIYLAPGETDMAYGIHNKQAKILAAQTREQGINSEIVYLNDPKFLECMVEISKQSGHVVHSGVMGYPSWVMIDRVQSANLFDLLNINIFAILGDHLFADFMWQRLQKVGRKTNFYAQEPSMLEELEILGPGGNPSFEVDFLPPITTVDEGKARQGLDTREIDILVPWAINSSFADVKNIEHELSKMSKNGASVGKLLMEKMRTTYDQSVLSLFNECYAKITGSNYQFNREKTHEDFMWMKVLHLVDQHIRHWRRFEMLKQVADLSGRFRIVITADKKKARGYTALQSQSNIEWTGQVSTDQLEQLYANSKIVLNCNPTYPDYLHGRVKESMRWGCCLITDRIPGLERRFSHREHLLFTDQENTLAPLLEVDLSEMQQIALRGKAIMNEKYTQKKFCQLLLKQMNQQIKNN